MKNKIIIFGSIVLSILVMVSSFSKNSNPAANVSLNCSIELDPVNDSVYIVRNYVGPYVFSNKVLSGAPVVTHSNDTVRVHGSGYSLILMARDSNNCLAQQIINKY